jgi:hypothetical protein
LFTLYYDQAAGTGLIAIVSVIKIIANDFSG